MRDAVIHFAVCIGFRRPPSSDTNTSDSCLMLGSTPLFTPPPLPIGRSAGTLLPSLLSSISPRPVFRQTGGLEEPATHPLVASRPGHYLGPRRSIYPSCLGPCCPPFPSRTFWISLVLGVVPLVAIAAAR